MTVVKGGKTLKIFCNTILTRVYGSDELGIQPFATAFIFETPSVLHPETYITRKSINEEDFKLVLASK